MHTKISSGKEHRRHRARRAAVLLVVLALLFTMLPTGLYTVADAAPAEEEPALVPAPEEALPEPEDSMTKEEETDSKSPLSLKYFKENGRPLWTISNSIRSK